MYLRVRPVRPESIMLIRVIQVRPMGRWCRSRSSSTSCCALGADEFVGSFGSVFFVLVGVGAL